MVRVTIRYERSKSVARSERDPKRAKCYLDRWLLVERADRNNILFQVEVKNWSANSLGGKGLRRDASAGKTKSYRIKNFERLWDEEQRQLKEGGGRRGTRSVLLEMQS